MSEVRSSSQLSIARLIFLPALLSFAVTILRLIGEREHWSPHWFSTETGGPIPSGMSWLIGITWLALPFGVYFALRLAAAGHGPRKTAKAVGFAFTGLVILLLVYAFLPRLSVGFPQVLILIWLAMAIPAAIQLLGWPELFKTLLAYGLAARIPVVIVMFFAMRGDWGTHYDFVGMPEQFQMPLWPRFFWLAFFPQLVFWVAFTILMGSLTGSIAFALFGKRRLADKAEQVSSAATTDV
jgi:uncharacterized membrane protein